MKTHLMKAAPLTIMFAALFIFAACSKKDSSAEGDAHGVDYYTCSMHPSVKSKDPNATCPICSMDLMPVMKQDATAPAGGHLAHGPAPGVASPKPGEFTVPVERQQMIGVTYATVERRSLETTLRTVGVIEPDAGLAWEYVSRVDGYVQELFVTSAGRKVERDQPLLTIYSPDLLTTEQEFVDLLRSRDNATSDSMRRSAERMIESAKRRLQLWNIGDEEIATLEKIRKASDLLTLRSPFDGIVERVSARQGMSVKAGEPLISLLNLSTVWMWADFYENELPLLHNGQKLKVTVPAFGDQEFEGEIAVIDPMVNPMKRTVRVRIDIPNPEWALRPGMFVNAWLDVRAGEGLTVPVSAVMPTGNRNIVFVDKGEGRIEPRFVQLGRKFTQAGERTHTDYYEVRGGLKNGERVVASGNFLIDAESKIQGVLKTWEVDDADAAAVEKPAMPAGPAQGTPLPPEAAVLYEPLIAAYIGIQRTLAHDQMDGVAAGADAVREQVGSILASNVKPDAEVDAYDKRLRSLEKAAAGFEPGNLEEARIQFGTLSAELIALLDQFPPPVEQPLYTVNCPMWDKSPSRWLQTSKEIVNPFMGQAMPGCGEIVKPAEAAR